MPRHTSPRKWRRNRARTEPEPDATWDAVARKLVRDGRCPGTILESHKTPLTGGTDRGDRDAR